MNPNNYLIANDIPNVLVKLEDVCVSDIMRKYLKDSLNEIIKQYQFHKNEALLKGSAFKSLEYFVSEYLKENNI